MNDTNSNPDVVKVNRECEKITITALKMRTITITLQVKDSANTVTKTITVTVDDDLTVNTTIKNITMYKGDYYDISNIVSGVSGTLSNKYKDVCYGAKYDGFILDNSMNGFYYTKNCDKICDDFNIYVNPNATYL